MQPHNGLIPPSDCVAAVNRTSWIPLRRPVTFVVSSSSMTAKVPTAVIPRRTRVRARSVSRECRSALVARRRLAWRCCLAASFRLFWRSSSCSRFRSASRAARSSSRRVFCVCAPWVVGVDFAEGRRLLARASERRLPFLPMGAPASAPVAHLRISLGRSPVTVDHSQERIRSRGGLSELVLVGIVG